MRRDLGTLTLYAAFGCLGYVLTGLGVVLPELRTELALSRAEVALYPSAFALGLVLVGIAGDRAARALGSWALPVSLAALGGGALILASGIDRVLSGAGALLLGLGGAGLVQLVPTALRAAHGQRAAVAIGEANAVSSSAAVLAPLLVGVSLAAGLGWRAGYVGLPVAAAAVLVWFLTRTPRAAGRPGVPATPGAAEARDDPRDERAPRTFVGRWLDIVLVVAVEFSLVFWAADFLRAERDLAPDAAAATAALLVLGMAIGRAATSAVTRVIPVPSHLLAVVAVIATVGVVILWAVDQPTAAGAGLLLAGLGVALLYPLTLAEALATWPGRPERAAARCALASGVAIGLAPPLLGALADAYGLRTAILLAPVLLLVFLIRCTGRRAAAVA